MSTNSEGQQQQQPQPPQQAQQAQPTQQSTQPQASASAQTSLQTTNISNPNASSSSSNPNSKANIIAALSSAFKTSTGESLQHDKIAQLLIANMDQISELARQGRLSQTQIDQLKQFAAGNTGSPATAPKDTTATQPQAGPATATTSSTRQPMQPQLTQTTPVMNAMAPAGAAAFKTSSPAPGTVTTLTATPGNGYPISATLNVTNPGPQPFPAAIGRPTMSGGFASGRVSGTPAQIARTDDSSVLSSDTSSRRKNTPNDQSLRRSIQDLVFSIDPNVKVEPDVEDLLLDIADEFIDSVTNFGCRLAKHRGGDSLEVRDLQLHLERNHNIRIPGFASDETRLSISQSVIAPAAGTTGSSSKKGAQNANVTLRSQRLAQVAQAKKEAKSM